MSVLVGYDGSAGSDAAVGAAARLFPGQHLAVLTVWSSARSVAPAGLLALPADVIQGALDVLDRAARDQARELAERAAARLGPDAEALTAPAGPNVWSTLAEQAEEREADAIIVGSRGRSDLSSVVLGSVAHGLVHHANRPVLIVPDRA